jgi:hypothetical protein
MADVGFLICVERGRLESEAVLLVESLRRFGGSFADAPVYAFAPRPANRPAAETVDSLASLDVTYVAEDLVERFESIPTFNKIPVCAWAERELAHETLVFTDTDTIFLNEPLELDLAAGDWVAAARPVDRRIAGSKGKGKNEPYWRRMYEALEVRSEPFITTAVGGMRIRAYWNSGLLAARRSAGVFGAWAQALERLYDLELVYHRRPHFMDQLSFAAVTADVHDRLRILSDPYNYPLRHRPVLVPEARDLDLDEIVHLHYRLLLHLPDALVTVQPPFDPMGERYRWLEERIPLEPVVPPETS